MKTCPSCRQLTRPVTIPYEVRKWEFIHEHCRNCGAYMGRHEQRKRPLQRSLFDEKPKPKPKPDL